MHECARISLACSFVWHNVFNTLFYLKTLALALEKKRKEERPSGFGCVVGLIMLGDVVFLLHRKPKQFSCASPTSDLLDICRYCSRFRRPRRCNLVCTSHTRHTRPLHIHYTHAFIHNSWYVRWLDTLPPTTASPLQMYDRANVKTESYFSSFCLTFLPW